MSGFVEKHSFEERLEESKKILEKYPERIPIIVEKQCKSDIPEIDKRKFLVPSDITVGQFIYIIRKRIKLQPEKSIFVFINNILPPPASNMCDIYNKYKCEDGFIYVTYAGENTFG